MLDRLGRKLYIGQLISVINHPELPTKCNWEVMGFIDYEVSVDVILKSFINNEVVFINILDVEIDFN